MEKNCPRRLLFCEIFCAWVIVATCLFAGFSGLAMGKVVAPFDEEGLTLLESSYTIHYANGQEVQIDQGEEIPRAAVSGHPLGESPAMVLPMDEIAVLPSDYNPTGITGVVLDDAWTSYAEKKTFPYPDSYLELRHVIAGDFDGDRRDELLGVDYGIVKLWDDMGANFQKVWEHKMSALTGTSTWGREILAAGDVDGDGADEIIYLLSWNNGGSHDSGRFYVYDYQEEKCLYASETFDEDSGLRNIVFSENIATGDFDGDGLDEIVLSLDTFYWGRVYDDALASPAFKEIYSVTGSEDPHVGVPPFDRDLLFPGDIDGDGLDEIVSVPATSNPAKMFVRDWIGNTFTRTEYTLDGNSIMKGKGGDFDGDGRMEIVLSYSGINARVQVFDDQLANFVELYDGTPSYADKCDFDTGDVNGDGLDELIFVNSLQTTVWKYHESVSGNFTIVHQDLTHKGESAGEVHPISYIYVVCGNFDGDGAELTYTGETWGTTTPPGILLALAAPPITGASK